MVAIGVIPIITLPAYRIDIFCFTHPPLLLGKFLQRGSAASAACFNTAVLPPTYFFRTRITPFSEF
jgi:hypothetical protein